MHDSQQALRQGMRQAVRFQGLRGHPQMQIGRLAAGEIRCSLPHVRDQGGFQVPGFLEPLPGRKGGSHMHERRYRHVVAGNAQLLEVVQSAADSFRVHSRDAHQFIGRYALVGVRIQKFDDDLDQLLPAQVRQAGHASKLLPGIGHGIHAQRRRKDLGAILLPRYQARFFQPGDGGLDAGVIGCVLAFEGAVFVFTQDLAGCRDHLSLQTILAVKIAQRLENPVDLTAGQARAGRHAELPFHILLGIQQHASREFPVAPGAPCFLQEVLQRSRDIRMNDEPDIGFVDAHAESVGGDNHPQFAVDETLLGKLLGLGLQSGMEMGSGQVFADEVVRDVFAMPPGRAVDDRAARPVRRQIGHERPVDILELVCRIRIDDHKIEVLPPGATVEYLKLDAEFLAEVVLNVPHNVGLGGGGQANYRRNRQRVFRT